MQVPAWLALAAGFILFLRLSTWGIGWVIARTTPLHTSWAMILANTLGLAAFEGYLIWDRYPGEPIDVGAVLFGGLIFGAFALVDLFWLPWRQQRTH